MLRAFCFMPPTVIAAGQNSESSTEASQPYQNCDFEGFADGMLALAGAVIAQVKRRMKS